MAEVQIDEAKLEEFMERIVGDLSVMVVTTQPGPRLPGFAQPNLCGLLT